jgi:hypothetical protein
LDEVPEKVHWGSRRGSMRFQKRFEEVLLICKQKEKANNESKGCSHNFWLVNKKENRSERHPHEFW